MRLKATLVKNAASNLLRGGTTAVVNLALPHFLIKTLDVDRFSAWSLMLQIAAYASFFDFGLQTAVGRFVAHCTELGQLERRKKLIETSYCAFLIVAALAMIVIGVVTFVGNHIFKGLPPQLLHEFRMAGIILGFGAALQLTFSPFTGVLVGLHRNELPAIATIVSRLGGAFAVILLARHTHSLIVLASAIAVANLLAGAIQYLAVIYYLPAMRRMHMRIDSGILHELFRFCMALGVLTLSMFVIQGLDVTIIGRFQFSQVGYYTIAASVIGMISGLSGAILTSLTAPFAVLQARGDASRIATSMLDVTWGTSLANGALILLFVLWSQAILSLWVGGFYATLAGPILVVLLFAQAIRLMASPLSTALIACGLHGKAVVSSIAEALVNLLLSVYLVQRVGAIGVAYGTLAGAVISILLHLLYTLPKTPTVPVRPKDLLYSGLALPLLALSPLILYALTRAHYVVNHSYLALSASFALMPLTAIWSWKIQRARRSSVMAYRVSPSISYD